MRWDHTLINKLFHDMDPLEGLDEVMAYYNRYYDDGVIVTGKNLDREIIPYHLKDLVVGYVPNMVTNKGFIPVLGRVSRLDYNEIYITPIKVLSEHGDDIEVNDINDKLPLKVSFKMLYPIVLTPSLLLKLGFSMYNINGFYGYRKNVNGLYIKIKVDTEHCEYVNYTMRFGTNVFRGAYLHQLMGILNLYFGL